MKVGECVLILPNGITLERGEVYASGLCYLGGRTYNRAMITPPTIAKNVLGDWLKKRAICDEAGLKLVFLKYNLNLLLKQE